ncbi:MAG: hypothetical protein IPL79_02040 [Myxococcales bacterium]|nr:hypothetical protein [Myxococcales bacterium]
MRKTRHRATPPLIERGVPRCRGLITRAIRSWSLRRSGLHAWAAVVGGRIITEVGTWPLMPGMGVHPLGGCRMGKSLEDGVVDSYGRVFHPRGGHYRGLRIVDASIVPDAVGVPTSLTIAAVAERAAEQLLRELAA